MSWITEMDYRNYDGERIPPEEFPRYAQRACEAVDAASGWKIARAGMDSFDDFVQRQICAAACAQAEFLWLHGAEAALDGSAHGGYTIGKTQISGSASVLRRGGLCAKALHALAPTGLLYAGVCI